MQLTPDLYPEKEGEGSLAIGSGKVRCGQRHDTEPGPVKLVNPIASHCGRCNHEFAVDEDVFMHPDVFPDEDDPDNLCESCFEALQPEISAGPDY